MDPFGLGLNAYGSDDEDSQSQGKQAKGAGILADSSNSGSDSDVDSAELRALEAEAKLKDYNPNAFKTEAISRLLPAPTDAFDQVDDVPEFLNPEATRQVATTVSHGVAGMAAPQSTGQRGGKGKPAPGPEFDIAKLAPRLKGEKREGESSAVIEAKAKRYKLEDGIEASQSYSAIQIAMLGGQVKPSSTAAAAAGAAKVLSGPGAALPPGQEHVAGKGKVASRPQDVTEFLAKGEGAALLPRKTQERKDREKLKRAKGQTSVHGWKTEAEMVLRQQFDS